MKFISKYTISNIKNGTIKDCFEYCKNKKILGLDIETGKAFKPGTYNESQYQGGLDPYLSQIISIQIGDLNQSFVIDVRDFSQLELQPILDLLHWNNNITFVGHNLKFDGKHLLHKYNIRLKNVYDTMLAEISLHNGLQIGLSLAALSFKYLNIKTPEDFDLFSIPDEDDNDFKAFEEVENKIIDKSIRLGFIELYDAPMTYEQVIYGDEDIIWALKIREKQLQGHEILGFNFSNSKNINLESEYTQVCAEMELNGLPLDISIWQELAEKYKNLYYKRLDKLNNYVIKNYPKYCQLNLFNDGSCVIDWSSPKQVVSFFRDLKICDKEKSKQTKKMEWSVSAKAILGSYNPYSSYYIKDKDIDIIDSQSMKIAYLLLRKAQMNITTYGEDFLKYVHPITGRLHPNYRQHLISSRCATTSPNLLAIPSTHRHAFKVNKSKLIVHDYSSLESRIIAAKSKDPALLDFFNNGSKDFGSDFHSYTASLVGKVKNPDYIFYPKEDPITGEKNPLFTPDMATIRQNTKSVNFGIAYGITAHSLSKQLGITLQEAEEFIKTYFTAFPVLQQFIQNSQKKALQDGYVIFMPYLNAIYIQQGFEEIKQKEEYNKQFFFTEEYRALNQEQRNKYKEELYKNKPEIKANYTDIGIFKSRLGNRGCNLKIQGMGAKIIKLAQIGMRRYIAINNVDWKLCLQLHDEAASESKNNYELVNQKQKEFMIKAANKFVPEVKMEVSGGIYDSWTH
jgi:DNA polymerase I-like protein with 3'-5' exonuclease and polymerase domains